MVLNAFGWLNLLSCRMLFMQPSNVQDIMVFYGTARVYEQETSVSIHDVLICLGRPLRSADRNPN